MIVVADADEYRFDTLFQLNIQLFSFTNGPDKNCTRKPSVCSVLVSSKQTMVIQLQSTVLSCLQNNFGLSTNRIILILIDAFKKRQISN